MYQLISSRAALLAATVLLLSVLGVPFVHEAGAENARPTGCVLLRNHNVLFGNATQRAGQILVTRSNGSQIQLDRRNVLCWGSSLEDLYEYQVDHRIVSNATEHLACARWCMKYDLFEEALEELKHAESLRIDQTEIVRLKRQLYRSVIAKQKSSSPKKAVAQNKPPVSAVAQVAYQEEIPAKHTKPATQTLDQNTLRTFLPIQPTLVTRCGGCHNVRTDTQWSLHLPHPGSRLSNRLTRENLVATLAYVDFDAPQESELLKRMLDGHAGDRSIDGPRDAVALRSMEYWMQNARPAGSPLALAKKAYEKSSVKPKTAKGSVPVASDTDLDEDVEPKQIAKLPVANPFDPEIFNRQMHK